MTGWRDTSGAPQAGHTSGKHPLYLCSEMPGGAQTWAAHGVGFCAGRHHLASGAWQGRAGPGRRGNRAGVGADVPREPSLQGAQAVHPDMPPTPDTSGALQAGALQAGRRVAWAGPSVSCQRWGGQHEMTTPSPHARGHDSRAHTQGPSQGTCTPGMSHREPCSVKNTLQNLYRLSGVTVR